MPNKTKQKTQKCVTYNHDNKLLFSGFLGKMRKDGKKNSNLQTGKKRNLTFINQKIRVFRVYTTIYVREAASGKSLSQL